MRSLPTIRWRLLLIVAVAVAIPTALLGVSATVRSSRAATKFATSSALTKLRAIAIAFERTIQDTRRITEFAAKQWAEDVVRQRVGAERSASNALLAACPILAHVSITNRDGLVVFGPAIDPQLELGRDSFGGYVTNAVTSANGASVFVVVQARSRSSERIGAFVAEISTNFVALSLQQYLNDESSELLILDSNNKLVGASKDNVGHAVNEGVIDGLRRASARASAGWFEAADMLWTFHHLADFESSRGIPWVVLQRQPTHVAYALSRTVVRDALVIGAIAIVLALAIGVVLTSRLIRPLRRLTLRAEQIAGGASAAREPVQGPGEIATLAASMESMAERLQERNRLQQALARGDRLASVGVMSAQVAHEINNPLTTVLGYAKLLAEGKEEDHPDRAGLDLIASEAERMQRSVASLLRYARAESTDDDGSRDEQCGLQSTVDQALSLVLPTAKKQRIEITTDLPANLVVAIAGRQLEQVLVNLLNNAAYETQTVDSPEIRITANASRHSDVVEIAIADNGPGIAEERRNRIFDPFYSSKPASAGTGLGLAVCKHILTRCRGSIRCESNSRGGATFVVTLPVVNTANSLARSEDSHGT